MLHITQTWWKVIVIIIIFFWSSSSSEFLLFSVDSYSAYSTNFKVFSSIIWSFLKTYTHWNFYVHKFQLLHPKSNFYHGLAILFFFLIDFNHCKTLLQASLNKCISIRIFSCICRYPICYISSDQTNNVSSVQKRLKLFY